MQSSWVSREERWSSAQPAEPPSRESHLGTGNRVPAGLHTGALQIHGGSSTKAGPVLQCWAAGQGRLLRAMPSTAAGISPGPTDGYEEQSLGWCFFPRHKSLFKNCLVPGQGPCGMWEGHGHAEPAQEMSPVARGAEPGWSVGPGRSRDMGLPLPGDMCGYGHWSEGGSKVIAVMNTVALEALDPASPVPAALKRALLMPAGLACLSLCLSSSGAALAAGRCRPHTFASNFANGAGPPVLPP